MNGKLVELCAKTLSLCYYQSHISHEEHITLQLACIAGRTNIITFNRVDRETLAPATYVNDNVVDFWMLWVTRNEQPDTSEVKPFTSHFYSTLIGDGIDKGLVQASHWLKKRKIDIFSYKLILLPINLNSHWSLCVIVNLNKFRDHVKLDKVQMNSEIPFMMLLDSLGMHGAEEIGQNIRKWLVHEWNKFSNNVDLDERHISLIPIFSPKGTVIAAYKVCSMLVVNFNFGDNKNDCFTFSSLRFVTNFST